MISSTVQFSSQSTLPDSVSDPPDIAGILHVFAGNVDALNPVWPRCQEGTALDQDV